ncbi:MFS transporter [Terrimesophilobacter mesophilus]|uniref:MFS transporter n=1 Tax=Terrimesophilobacter mesophilus TaxID=433647 RepID=A0A4R8VD11_9MICO|nr:MFS transporter [Terrimesophilobacter mesophilus]TFB80356.1 MFS transporter [Terrimesophilobacter mesophilus]
MAQVGTGTTRHGGKADRQADSGPAAAGRAKLGPAFANLFTANIASSLGDGIARTAIPLLAVQVTLDPLLISGISALAMLPWLFFAIPAGILIDRIDRRAALALANGVRTILAVALFVITSTGNLTIWWLYIIIFIYGMFETVYDGAIRAVAPSILAKAQLPRANSLIEAGEQVIQNFVSGPITSLLFAVSVLIPLGANAAVYALAVILAILLPKIASGRQFAAAHAARHGESAVWYKQFVDGYRFIVSNKQLKTLWFLSTFSGMCTSIATASLVLYLVDRLQLPEALFGVYMLTGAAGGIGASMIASRMKARWGTGLSVAIGNLVASIGIVAVGAFPNLWAVGIAWVFISAGITVWNILIMSLRQSIIPGRLLGRVHGTWRTLLWGSMPVGSIIGGLIGRIDLVLPFIIGGGLSALAGIIWFQFLMTLPNPEDVDNGDDAAIAGAADAGAAEAGVTGAGPTDPVVEK